MSKSSAATTTPPHSLQGSRSSRGLRPLALAIGLLAGAPAALAAPSASDIEKDIARAMDTFQVPGMAVAVVHQGKTWYSGGTGIAEMNTANKVDDDTLFQIASVTKAFTAAALALLVDEGKVEWDAPVIDYLPDFRMYDPWVTREFTVRDLLTHRSGLPLGAGDLLLVPQTNTTRDEVVRAMRHLKPSSSFRSEFAYDNLLFIIAGEVIAAASGMPYEDFVERELLAPIGMGDCTAGLTRVPASASKATPHLLVDGEWQITDSLANPLIAPTGGINCSAGGMALWMQFLLADGKTRNGEQLVSREQMKELFNPVTLTQSRSYLVEHAGAFLTAYALGWNVSTFYGQPVYTHGGGLWGMTTYIALLPEQDLAVFASNNLMSSAPLAVVNDIVDSFLAETSNESGKDWVAIAHDAANTRVADADSEVAQAAAERDSDSTPRLPLKDYTGTYNDPWYGNIEISLNKKGQLWFTSERSATLEGPLEHFQYDTFIARWTDTTLNADAYVSFELSPEGGVEGIQMKAVSPATDFSFDFHDLNLRYVPEEG
ncbi:serine hydrolase [Parahaliea aestuarii]|nr:serine hydrolase [Parahaliea aestuarii]